MSRSYKSNYSQDSKSYSKSINHTLDASHQPEQQDQINYFQALKELRRADAQVDIMKKRVKVFQRKANKQDHSLFEYSNLVKMREAIKQDADLFKQEFKHIQSSHSQHIQEIKEKSHKFKQQHQFIKSKNQLDLLHNKMKSNIQLRTKSQQNERLIRELKEKAILEKRQKWKEEQEKSYRVRHMINQYMQNRIQDVRENRREQTKGLLEILKDKEKELKNLGTKQQDIIRKTDQSSLTQKINKESKDLINHIQYTNKQHSKKSSRQKLRRHSSNSMNNKMFIFS